MNLIFENDLSITKTTGRLQFFQGQPQIEPEPIMLAEGRADGLRVQAYSVLKDRGMFRMWYLSFPAEADVARSSMVSYAESDDGIVWRRPKLNLFPEIAFDNNYCNLGLMSPGVFVDPNASAEKRYRAVGYLRLMQDIANHRGAANSFYTAHSADGIRWQLDAPTPRWYSGDTISAIYHEGRGQGLAAMKYVRRMSGRERRAIWTATCRDGIWGDPACALMPDEYDDIVAVTRGGVSGDYYGMGMLPAGMGTVGFICHFRHYLPYATLGVEHYAIYGVSDIGLAYQAGEQDRWLHVPGRPAFIAHGSQPWNAGWVSGVSTPVRVGDEHWLYLNGMRYDHAWYLTPNWEKRPALMDYLEQEPHAFSIGLARWPAWRLFGYHADPEGILEIELGRLERPARLMLNYQAERQGSIRVQLFRRLDRGDMLAIEPFSLEETVVPLSGDRIREAVQWKMGDVVPVQPEGRIVARITMDKASLYAWEWSYE